MKKWFSFFVATVATVLFFSSCNSISDPDPVRPMVEKIYTVEMPCVSSHSEPINLCSGGVSAFSRVNGWKNVIDTSYTQFVFTATGYNATDLVVNGGPGGKITEERTIVSNPSRSDYQNVSVSRDHKRNPIWPWIWPVLVAIAVLVLCLFLLRVLYEAIKETAAQRRIEADQNRRDEEEHQQCMRDQEWARMREVMGLNRQTDGDLLSRMKREGMNFSVDSGNGAPKETPAGGEG